MTSSSHTRRLVATELTILLVDIDRFRAFNDLNGHLAGDTALERLAALLRTQTRDSDVLARFGGEEFVILLPACGVDDALRRAEHIRSLVERTTTGWAYPITVSIGAATMPVHAASVVELLGIAEAALHVAKGRGRNATALAGARVGDPGG